MMKIKFAHRLAATAGTAAAAFVFSASAYASLPSLDAALRVTVNKFEQLPNRDVEVSYTLSGQESAIVRVSFLTNGVALPRELVRTVSGDWSESSADLVTAGANKKITWKLRKDWTDAPSPVALSVQVKAFYPEELATAAWGDMAFDYLVIDLAGGDSYPVVWRDSVTLDANNTGGALSRYLVMKRIPAGSVRNEPGNYTIKWTKPFYMAVYETTNKQWENVMGSSAGASTLTGPWQAATKITYNQLDEAGSKYPGYVYDNNANSFFGKLNRRTGFRTDAGATGLRLPSELQWEYAARADATGDYAFGASSYDEAIAAGMSIHCNCAHAGEPNAFGLYCMPGGVAEICADRLATSDETAAAAFGGKTMTDYRGADKALDWEWQTKVPSPLLVVRDYQAYMSDPSAHYKLGERILEGWTRWVGQDNTLGFRVVYNPPAPAHAFNGGTPSASIVYDTRRPVLVTTDEISAATDPAGMVITVR